MHSANDFRFSTLAVAVVCVATTLPANAGSLFDFEDGTLQGWLSATSGGSGSTLVELHNGSLMASAQHSSSGTHSLSHDFAYAGSDVLSFDMHAVAVAATGGGSSANAYSGLTVTFLNAFNVSLGGFSLFNTTSPATLTGNQYAIDSAPHSYAGTMSSFAAQAGVNTPSQIATVSFSFVAEGQFVNINAVSSSKVWFDNFQVGAVPEPSSATMLLAGIAWAVTAAGYQKRKSRPRTSNDRRG